MGINLDGEAATRAMLEQQGLGKAPEGTQADLEEMSWLESVAASAGECFMRAAWRTWRAPGHLAAALTHLPASLLCRWRILLRAQQHRPAARQGGVRPGLQEPGEVLAAVRVGARSMPQQQAAGCARGAQRGSRPARASPRPTTRSWPANTGQVVLFERGCAAARGRARGAGAVPAADARRRRLLPAHGGEPAGTEGRCMQHAAPAGWACRHGRSSCACFQPSQDQLPASVPGRARPAAAHVPACALLCLPVRCYGCRAQSTSPSLTMPPTPGPARPFR